MNYFILAPDESAVAGPFPVEALRRQLERGTISPASCATSDLDGTVPDVRKRRANDWFTVGDIPELNLPQVSQPDPGNGILRRGLVSLGIVIGAGTVVMGGIEAFCWMTGQPMPLALTGTPQAASAAHALRALGLGSMLLFYCLHRWRGGPVPPPNLPVTSAS